MPHIHFSLKSFLLLASNSDHSEDISESIYLFWDDLRSLFSFWTHFISEAVSKGSSMVRENLEKSTFTVWGFSAEEGNAELAVYGEL